jgi:sigma-B regulation protein RsbU (phosphoserine phosphatase)
MPFDSLERDRLELLIEVASCIELPRLGQIALEGLVKVHRVQGAAFFVRTGRDNPWMATILRSFPLPRGAHYPSSFRFPERDVVGRGDPEFEWLLAACEPPLATDSTELVLILDGDPEVDGMLFLRGVPWGERRHLARFGAALGRALVNSWRLATARRISHERRILLDLQRNITASLRIDAVLKRLLDSLADAVPYDAAAIFLLSAGRGEFQPAIVRGFPTASGRLRLKTTQGIAGLALQRGEIVTIPRVEEEPRYLPVRATSRSSVALPLTVGGNHIGVLVLESDTAAAYHTEQHQMLGSIAAQAAVAIENARLHAAEIQGRALHRELKTARAIQRRLLPRHTPQPPGWEILGTNFPSLEMSGDFYDVIQLGSQVGLVVGDVMGKGAPAAMLAATLHAGLREGLRREDALADAVSGANRMLCGARFGRARFASVFVALLDPLAGTLEYVNAGHDPPLVQQPDGSWLSLESGGLVLGVIADASYQVGSLALRPNTLLMIYTDGVTEARDPQGEEFGLEALQLAISDARARSGAHLHHILRAILARLRTYRQGERRHDDVTLLGAWYHDSRVTPT